MRDSIRSLIKSVAHPAVERYLRRAQHQFHVRRFKPYVKSIATESVAFDFLIADPVAKRWYDVGPHGVIPPRMLFIRDHLINEGDVIFDCGAHHGFVSILLAKWTGDTGAVLAFEPIPANVDTLRANVDLNRIHNVMIEQKALGQQVGDAYFNLASNAHSTDKAAGEVTVAMTDLDSYAHLNPHLLIIDVEGSEIEVLKGARKILRRHPKLVIEIHPDMLDSPTRRMIELFSVIDIEKYDAWIQWDPARPPERYDRRIPITKRAHLFLIPAQGA